MRFLRNVLATIVGLFVFSFLAFFMLISIGAALGSSSEAKVTVKEKTVLELDLSKVKYDYGGKYNFKDLNFVDEDNSGLANVLNAIAVAKSDDKIQGISILNNTSTLGVSQRGELRQALKDFKESGKFVLSYANMYSQSEYYLSSVADTIYVNPVGEFDFRGLATEILYMKDLQEKTGVKMEVIRHGKYKSAVEPFLENKMSEANHEQISVFLNSIWASVVKDIAESRSISVDKLNELAENLGARTPELALKNGLVDKVAYEDEYHAAIKKAIGVAADKDYNTLKILDYVKSVKSVTALKVKDDQIAVIYAQGQIMSGEGNVNYIGEGSINRALKKARKNDKVKAIVLRVDSPGGSALTSDLIWREIELTKKEKPVIVSMGSVAASGGYYISCNADRIFADETTITGSIGVFGMLPNFSEVASKYGVNAQQVRTHKNAIMYSPFKPIEESTKGYITESIEKVYDTFVSRVAAGRNMTVEQVDSIAQGRVWTGTDALQNGLVDEIGGLKEAIDYAVSKVELEDYQVVNYPEYELTFDDLLRKYLGASMVKTQDELIKEKIGEDNFELIERLNYFNSMKGVQAMLPYELTIY
ncbi:signal peptide peptidase SppA [Myroides pelagicus]|uniref:Signal peptide peptidase SppA n=1 Tax=Myroides pelagicus TaxID=270914 RepID=A0A7K1GPM4_9FLAO|nr:signal peptide peptidase SppA [Myroides pelagicus]MEC4112893.1 signal peptide peptidase SppA [Myroides pelagicus]MTH30862.1 signal peptide peptidase SppA [Myroides pelagicus]